MAQPTESSGAPRIGTKLRKSVVRTVFFSVASIALALILIAVYAFTPSFRGQRVSQAAADGQTIPAHTSSISPTARNVAAKWSKSVGPRSASEAKVEQAGLAKHQGLKAPTLSKTTQKAAAPSTLGQPLAQPSTSGQGFSATKPQINTGPLADTDFVTEQSNSSKLSGGPALPCPSGFCSTVAEPSLAVNGKYQMMSYNWYDTFSTDGGSTWSYLDPFSEFTSFTGVGSFCCDQQVIYEPSRDTMFWEQLYEGTGASNPAGIGIATASGTDLTSWCFYYFTGANFGGTAGDLLDFPDLEFTNDNMFVSFNRYVSNSFVSSYIARMPLTAMSSCASFSFSYASDATVFTQALTQGAQGTMWYVSDAYVSGGTTGSQLHICSWQDPASSPSCVNRNITPFNYTDAPDCSSSDSVVTNWCTRLDSRARSAFFTKANFRGFGPATLGVALTVGPAGADPYPWVAIYYFEVAGLVAVSTVDALFNNGYAIAYPSFAANFRGFIGGEVSIGGGIGGTHIYPGAMIIIYDPTSPTPPFATSRDGGVGNATEWGDYMTVRPVFPSAFAWIAAFWDVDGTSTPDVGEVIFDRGRDHNAYSRWANS